MLANYFSILVFFGVGIFIGFLALWLGWFLGPRYDYKAKLSPYECGFEAFQNARLPFNVRFYLVAILFIVFDIETAFLFPWAIILRHIAWSGFLAMIIFLSILLIGFVYEWKSGALEWE